MFSSSPMHHGFQSHEAETEAETEVTEIEGEKCPITLPISQTLWFFPDRISNHFSIHLKV